MASTTRETAAVFTAARKLQQATAETRRQGSNDTAVGSRSCPSAPRVALCHHQHYGTPFTRDKTPYQSATSPFDDHNVPSTFTRPSHEKVSTRAVTDNYSDRLLTGRPVIARCQRDRPPAARPAGVRRASNPAKRDRDTYLRCYNTKNNDISRSVPCTLCTTILAMAEGMGCATRLFHKRSSSRQLV